MQSGLDDSGRMIALYSPEYETPICQANGRPPTQRPLRQKRKLIPFLLRPTALNRSRVKSPINRWSDCRRKSENGDPRRHRAQAAKQNIAQIRAELAETASPQPALNEDKQLDAGPNKVFDKPFVDHELVELPTHSVGGSNDLSALPRNARHSSGRRSAPMTRN